MLGFPGETEEHVTHLLSFLQKHPFNHVGCFGYSEEKGTRSAKLTDKLAPSVIKERLDRVMAAQFSIVQAHQNARIGTSIECIYEGHSTARSAMEAPDVDSKLILLNDSKKLKVGQLYTGVGIAHQGYDLLIELN